MGYSEKLFNAFTLLHGGSCYIETGPLIYRANQWTVLFLIGTSVMTELKLLKHIRIDEQKITAFV